MAASLWLGFCFVEKQKSVFQNCSGAAREGTVSHATEAHLATGLASLCL